MKVIGSKANSDNSVSILSQGGGTGPATADSSGKILVTGPAGNTQG